MLRLNKENIIKYRQYTLLIKRFNAVSSTASSSSSSSSSSSNRDDLLKHYGKWHTKPSLDPSNGNDKQGNSKNNKDNDNKQIANKEKWWSKIIPHFMLKPHITAKNDDFNRWLIPPVAIASHLCIGSVYAFSMLNEPLARSLGVVASAPSDWGLSQVVPIFSTSIVFLGLSAAVAGKFLEEVGPRTIGTASALLWGGSWLLGGIALKTHALPLLYLQGVLGGCGLGLGYVSPVSTMLRWFEDRRGLAAGMAIVGFGGGAMIAAPAFNYLLEKNFVAPTYLGKPEALHLITEHGKRFCDVGNGKLVEVVVATANDIAKLGFSPETTQLLESGVYAVGTGDTGAMATFCTIGSIYTAVMLACAFSYRIPREGWKPKSMRVAIEGPSAASVNPSSNSISPTLSQSPAGLNLNLPFDQQNAMIQEKKWLDLTPTKNHVDIDEALRTPQFYQLWGNLFLNVTSGIGVIAIAKTIMSDVFATSIPNIVDAKFCAGYVAAISLANLIGRIGWASTSDYIGRKRTFALFFGLGAPLYLSVPFAAEWAATNPGVVPLVLFSGATLSCFSFYGGGFSTIPAYIADIFGTMHVGGIHGRLLTAWSCAGVVGPLAVTYLRDSSTQKALHELANHVDPQAFEKTYGAPITELQSLIDAHSVTLANLMQLAPPGYVDPTPGLYSSTFFAMGTLLSLAFLNNIIVKPVHPKHWITPEQAAKMKLPKDIHDH